MIKYSRVYSSQSTIIPKEINPNATSEKYIIEWTINYEKEEISVDILSKNNISSDNVNNILQKDEFTYIYRNVSQKRHIVLPAEIRNVLSFDYRKHLLKWTITSEKTIVDKIVKADFINISGILDK